jgi:hypothetical protein
VFHAPFVGLVVFDAATLAQWGWSGSAWALVAPRLLEASVTYDPPSLPVVEGVTTTVTVARSALGDFARASFQLLVAGQLPGVFRDASRTPRRKMRSKRARIRSGAGKPEPVVRPSDRRRTTRLAHRQHT